MDSDQEQQVDTAVPLAAALPAGGASSGGEPQERGEVIERSETTQTGADSYTTVTERAGAGGMGGPSTQDVVDKIGSFFGVKSEGNEVGKGVGFINDLEQKAIGGIDAFENDLHKQTARDGGGVAGDIVNFIGDLGGGAAKAGVGLAGGLGKMVADPMGAIGGIVNVGGAISDAVGGDSEELKKMGSAVLEPMAKSWDEGKYGDAIGQGAVQVAALVEGGAGLYQGGKALVARGRGLLAGAEGAGEASEAASQAARAAGADPIPPTVRSPGVAPPPKPIEPVIEPAPTTTRTGQPPPAAPKPPPATPTPMPDPIPAGPDTLPSRT
jgi:hypothetical protein